MAQKLKLPDLPPNDDKEFWGDAEMYECTPQSVNSDGPHYFERVRGHEAYCGHCGWGFVLDRGDQVEGGHVFDRDKHIVI